MENLILNFIEKNPKDAFCIFREDGEIIYSNNLFKEFFHSSNFYDLILDNEVKEKIKNSKSLFEYVSILNSIVEQKPFLIRVFYKDGMFYSSLVDFSNHKEIVFELNKFKKIALDMPVIIIIFDRDYKINFVNKLFSSYFGSGNNKNLIDLLKDKVSEDFIVSLKEYIENEKDIDGRVILKFKDKNILFSVNLITVKEGNVFNYALVLKDLAFQEKVAEEMTKMSKFESLKFITDGVSHDLNNVLASLVGNISLAKLLIKPDSKAYSFIEEAENACSRAKDLSLKLLSIAKGLPMMKKEININKILLETTNFILRGKFFDLNIKLITEFEKKEFKINADEGQIIQVIDNIVTNACQAMPDGGEITIGTKEVEIVENRNYFPIKSGRYLCIYIKDTGKGISPLIISKIFDPYFTTKEGGNGIGLSISFSIIKNHRGYIDVISQIGVGSTFFIYLPFD
ncbi:MAG: two-component system sensor histidine kinase NtrB [Brevinematia bacterium]